MSSEANPAERVYMPWRDPDRLRKKYCDEEKSIFEIGDEWDCHYETVRRWLDNHDIETRETGGDNYDGPYRDPELLRRLYWDEEKTCSEVAEELDCSTVSVERWLRRNGIETRDGSRGGGSPKDAPWRDEETLRELYVDQELPMREVGEKLGCAISTVRSNLEKHGIERRPGCGQPQHRNAPWRDEETLRRLYEDEGYTSTELAEKWDTTSVTVCNWLHKFDIPVRGR